jgi:ABC-type transporter MlaC component
VIGLAVTPVLVSSLLAVWSLVVVAVPGVASAGEPTDALKDFFGAVNVVLKDPRTEDQPLEKLRAIRRHVDDVFDFREAAMLALGREWGARTPLEQNEFVALFADLLERAFVWRVAGKASLNGGVRVDYLREAASGDTAGVETALASRDGNGLRLEFRMVQRAGRWVIRDVVMDGVSTMENYHAQFQRIVRDASWPELVSQLRAKLGSPPGPVQVAAAAPVPAAPAPAPRNGPVRSAELADRPGADLPHAMARDVATAAPVVTRRETQLPAAALPPAAPTVKPTPEPVVMSTSPPVRAASLDAAPVAARVAALVTAASAPRETPSLEPAVITAVPSEPARVAVTPVRAIEPPRSASPAVSRPTAPPAIWVQVGAFKSASTAGRVATQVNGEILVVAEPATGGVRGEPLLRVRVGPFADRAQATARLREIRGLGYQPFLAAGD